MGMMMVIHLRVAVLVAEMMIIPLLLRSLIMVDGIHLLHPRHLIITMESGTPRVASQRAQSHGMELGGPNQTRVRNLMDIGAEMDGGPNQTRAQRSRTPKHRGLKLLLITPSQVGRVMVGSTSSDVHVYPVATREMDDTFILFKFLFCITHPCLFPVLLH